MLQNLNSKMHDFRRIGGVFTLLSALVILLAFNCTVSVEFEAGAASELHQSNLAPQPGAEKDEYPALRWSYHGRTLAGLRWENRSNLRSAAPPANWSLPADNDILINAHINGKIFTNKQPELTYYRRLWQKILPSRAGPCA